MNAEMIGTLISTTVAFAGLAAFFLLANVAFKAMGLGPVFMRPEDDPARKKAKTQPGSPSDPAHPTAAAAKVDPVQPESTAREASPDKQLVVPDPPGTGDKAGRLKTGLRRARLLTTLIVFGLSVVWAVSHLNNETPDWATACGWQMAGTIEIEAAADREQVFNGLLDEQSRKAVDQQRAAERSLFDSMNRTSSGDRTARAIEAGPPDPNREAALSRILDELEAEEAERYEYRRKAYEMMNQSSPEDAAEALELGDQFGVPRQAIEADPDYWRKRDAEAQRRLMESASPKTMAWLDNGERSCWSVSEVRLQALGIAMLPALVFFLMTFIVVWLGRWLLVLDRPR